MDCSTIIVSYNTFELTAEAVRTAMQAAGGLDHEVIVVDNDSPDGSAARLREAFPEDQYPNVHVLASGENLGFSRANNRGAARATGNVLFFLNPDTVVHGQAVRTLHDFLRAHPEAGAAGPHVLNVDGTDQASAFPFITARWMLRHYLPVGSLLRGSARRIDPVPDRTSPVDVVYGAALAIRRDPFDEVGGWDESYFMYAEETELCYALVRAGYVNYFVREAQITHYGGASSADTHAEQQLVHARSLIQFLKRHHRHLLPLHRAAGTVGFGVRAVLFRLLAVLRPDSPNQYRRRAVAASTLFRWFLLRHG